MDGSGRIFLRNCPHLIMIIPFSSPTYVPDPGEDDSSDKGLHHYKHLKVKGVLSHHGSTFVPFSAMLTSSDGAL